LDSQKKKKYIKQQFFMMNKNKGAALVSILALTSLALLIIASTTIISVINAKINLNQFSSKKTYQNVNALADEMILLFIRERSITNPYPSWTEDCLQIDGFDCRMELNLTGSGGSFDVWGKIKGKQRHVKVDISVDDQQRVTASKEEIY
jgi:hypothetical protein